jgi:hypothetical protein
MRARDLVLLLLLLGVLLANKSDRGGVLLRKTHALVSMVMTMSHRVRGGR